MQRADQNLKKQQHQKHAFSSKTEYVTNGWNNYGNIAVCKEFIQLQLLITKSNGQCHHYNFAEPVQ